MIKTENMEWSIYLPLPTGTKLFSSTMQVLQSEDENTLVNQFPDPVTWGYPGGLATVNQQAIKFGMEAATILNCELADLIRFERKNFLDPSLPGGYQIVQEKFPIGKNGWITIAKQKGLIVQSVGLTAAKGLEMIDEKGRHRFNYDFVGNPLLKMKISVDHALPFDFEASLKEVQAVLKQLSRVTDSLLNQVHFELTASVNAAQMIQVEVIQLRTLADLQLASHFLQNETNLMLQENRPLQVWALSFDKETQKYSLKMKINTPTEWLLLFDPDIPDIYLQKAK